MKKTIAFFVLALMSAGLYAQSIAPLAYMYSGMENSTNNFYGTARSVALGEAMTAVGGDLGSVVINPAGAAVNKYSQIAITPGITVSSVTSAYSSSGPEKYGSSKVNNKARVGLPGVGATITTNSGNEYGIRSFSFSIIASQTQDYNSFFMAGGSNSKTSLLTEFAQSACGYTDKQLSEYGNGVSWDLVAGYNGRLFGGIDTDWYAGNSSVENKYGDFCIPAALAQSSTLTTSGYKRDLLMNFAWDISGKLMLGFNLGIPIMYKTQQEAYYESPYGDYTDFYIALPDDKGKMVDTYYTGAYYKYNQYTRMSGVYAKFGAIYLPTDNLRIGAAIQTPTAYTVTEGYRYYAGSEYENSSVDGYSYSPEDEWSYRMRGPWSFNVGLAYTMPGKGLFSVDYELVDYSVMEMQEIDSDGSYFYNVNQTVQQFLGASHNLRFGLEYKVNPMVSLRAGYGVRTSAEKYWTDASGAKEITTEMYYNETSKYMGALGKSKYYKDKTRSVSFGAGYSSPGSFFADFAVRLNKYPSTVYRPFYDYDHYDIDGNWHELGTASEELSPRILNNSRLWDVMITFGWRF